MAELLVEDLDPETVERLEVRARSHGRTLQEEAKTILEAEAAAPLPLPRPEAYRIALESQRRFAGRVMSDSAELLREDRDR